jgi:hypothetical protein
MSSDPIVDEVEEYQRGQAIMSNEPKSRTGIGLATAAAAAILIAVVLVYIRHQEHTRPADPQSAAKTESQAAPSEVQADKQVAMAPAADQQAAAPAAEPPASAPAGKQPAAAPERQPRGIAILGSPAAIEEARKFEFSEKKPYLIIDGLVNKPTFWGYMRYGMYCFHCHGPDGLGSSYAPNLTLSLKSMSYEDFVQTVMNGRQNITTATTNVMPAFGEDPNVVNYIDNIYAYLKARSDGKIPQGRPDYLGEKKLF